MGSGVPPIQIEQGDATPVFRAPIVHGRRRPLRLESLYWAALAFIARERGQKLAQVIEMLDDVDSPGNATSTLRVAVLRWTMERIGQLKSLASLDAVRNIARASTAPTFVLGMDRKILFFNNHFQNYIRQRIPVLQGETRSDLRLAFDMQMDDLVAALRANGNQPLLIGFAVGYNDRRIRGQMNAVLHPVEASDVILGFVVADR